MTNSEDPDDIDEEEEISEDDISQSCPVSHKEAMAMFEKCLIWLASTPTRSYGWKYTNNCNVTRTCCGKARGNS